MTATGPGVADRVVVLGLGAAVAYAALAQGAFYGRQSTTVLLLVALAAAARVATRRPVCRAVAVAATCWVLCAGWALVSGWLHGDAAAAVPMAALACGLAAAAVAASGLPAESRRVLVGVLLAVAVVVAISCWVGVAFHLDPLALPSSGLWRGSSTITYANATAAFLVTALVLAVTLGPPGPFLVAVLLLGLAVTMSRAGLLGLAVAVAVVLVLARARLRPYLLVLPAVAVAFVGLLPSLRVGGAPQPLLALAGVAGGVVVLLVRGRHIALVSALVTVAAAALLLVLPAGPGLVGHAADGIASTRLTATSDERADLTRVTAAQFRSSPLTGVGPGQLNLHYTDHTGAPVHAQYTHNEYLQVAAESGVVGLALALAGAVAFTAGSVLRRQSRRRTPEAAATLAVVAAFAVHSAFDFLWHVPVLLLLMILSVTLLTGSNHDNHEEEVPR